MSFRIKKVLVEFVRATSHVRPAFRFEVPLLKLRNPGEKVAIHPIPNLSESDVQEFSTSREAYLGLQATYGQLLNQAYVDFDDFDAAFKATLQRDNVGVNIVQAPVGDTSADNAKLEALEALGAVSGVTPAIASAMFDGGFRGVEDIARASLDELEAFDGVGPAASVMINADAKRRVIGLVAAGDAPAEPVASNPFA